jgi:phage terminase large subunit
MRLEVDYPDKALDVLLPETTPSGRRVRYRVLHGGRDSAKSHSFARRALARGRVKREQILCVREVQESIADSVHRLLSQLVTPLGMGDFYDVQQKYINGANGTQFSFRGLSKETRDSLKSQEGTTICWIEEAHTISERSWDILEPTIRAPNSEIWVSFNPDMDTDFIYRMFVLDPPDDALVAQMNWQDNPWRSQVLDAARERMKRQDHEKYLNVYEGQCRPSVEGAIYRKEIEAMTLSKRFRPVPYDSLLKVHTVWDLGWNDLTSVIMVQRVGGELRIIDFFEDSHRTLPDYVQDLKERKYNWGTDYLPHDGDSARLESSGLSARDILSKLGRSVQIIPKGDIEAGIKAARVVFARCYFDKDRASALVGHLKRYRRQINQTTNEPGGPLHDEHSHACDAFRYLAQVADRLTNDDDGWNRKLKYDSRGVV